MQQQIFLALFLLHCINMFWYYLILRILVRAVRRTDVDDDRSDDEDKGDDDKQD
jgi:acyl-CoA-dependent ceramide synthase